MFCDYGIHLIIIIKNSKIALKMRMHFTFGNSPDSRTSLRRLSPQASVSLISKLLIFLIPLNIGKGKRRLEQSLKTLKMVLITLNLGRVTGCLIAI
jgi:hypothetical protein